MSSDAPYDPPGVHTLHCECHNALYHARYEKDRARAERDALREKNDRQMVYVERAQSLALKLRRALEDLVLATGYDDIEIPTNRIVDARTQAMRALAVEVSCE